MTFYSSSVRYELLNLVMFRVLLYFNVDSGCFLSVWLFFMTLSRALCLFWMFTQKNSQLNSCIPTVCCADGCNPAVDARLWTFPHVLTFFTSADVAPLLSQLPAVSSMTSARVVANQSRERRSFWIKLPWTTRSVLVSPFPLWIDTVDVAVVVIVVVLKQSHKNNSGSDRGASTQLTRSDTLSGFRPRHSTEHRVALIPWCE